MKKFQFLFLSFFFVMVLVACSNAQQEVAEEAAQAVAEAQTRASKVVLRLSKTEYIHYVDSMYRLYELDYSSGSHSIKGEGYMELTQDDIDRLHEFLRLKKKYFAEWEEKYGKE